MRDPRTLTSDELLALVTGARWFAAKDRVPEERRGRRRPRRGRPRDARDRRGPVRRGDARALPRRAGRRRRAWSTRSSGRRSPRGSRRSPGSRRRAPAFARSASSSRTAPSCSTSSTCSSSIAGSRQGRTPSSRCSTRSRSAGFANAPRLEGALTTEGPPLETALASVTGLVPSAGGGWELTLGVVPRRPVLAAGARLAARRGHRRAPRGARGQRRRPALRSRGAERRGARPARRRDRGGDHVDVRVAAGGRRPRRRRAPRRGPPRPRPGARLRRAVQGSRSGRTATTTSARCSGRRTATGS